MDKIVFIIPLISAFIGYVTNYIAIVMLFRPYEEIKILGIKIFGKGVIPRNHRKLAESIGRTVAEELLSSDDIIRKLNSEQINLIFKEAISSKLIEITKKNPESLEKILPHELLYLKDDIKVKASEIVSKKFAEILSENKEKFEDEISKLVQNISADSYNKILSANNVAALEKIFKNIFGKEIKGIIHKNYIVPKLENLLKKISYFNKNVGEIIPKKLDEEIRKNIFVITSEVVKQLKILINKEDVQKEIRDKLSDFSSELLENSNLGMLSMFITTDFIQDKINLLVAKGIPYLEKNLESDNYRNKISEFIISMYEDYSNKKIDELFVGYLRIDEEHSLNNIARIIYDVLFNSINNDRIIKCFEEYLDMNFDKLIDSFAKATYKNHAEISKLIYEKLFLFVRNNPNLIKEYIEKIIDFSYKIKLPRLSAIVNSNDVEELSHFILKIIRKQIELYLPKIFSTLDINGIVTEKVLGFPLPKLEKIIRNVAGKELKYITVFGAVLGFLIGLIQIIFIYI